MDEQRYEGIEELYRYFNGDKDLTNTPYLIKKLKKRRFLVELEKKDILARPGDLVDTCYLIEKGAVIVYEYQAGNRRILDMYEEKTMLFSDYVIFERPAVFFYEAREHTRMYAIQMKKVRSLLETDKTFNKCFMSQLMRDYLVMQDLYRKFVIHNARWRLCDFLLIFVERSGIKKDGSYVISDRLSQQMLADMLCVNRITVLREIHSLEELGLCRMRGGHFEVPDPELLRQYRDRQG